MVAEKPEEKKSNTGIEITKLAAKGDVLHKQEGGVERKEFANELAVEKPSAMKVTSRRSSDVDTIMNDAAKNTRRKSKMSTQGDDEQGKTSNKKKGGKEVNKHKKVDDQMNHEHLQQLEKIFKEGSAGEEGLDMEQFRIAMKKTMGNDIDDTELDMIFMKVDNNCDGTVDWDEYLSYMLLEYQEKKNMFTLDQDFPFPNLPQYKASNHLETICSVRMLQAFSTRHHVQGVQEPDDASSRYITISRDGVLNIWNLEWTLQKSTTLDAARGSAGSPCGNQPAAKSIAVTDMVCMTNCNTLAVATTDYEVSFYAMTSNMIKKRFQIKDMKNCALTMDYSYDIKDPRHAVMLWGDTSGSVVVIRFFDNPNLSLFAAPLCPNNRISMLRLLRGRIPGVQTVKFGKVHGDWVQQVRYFVNKKGQECFISGCARDDTALFFADITEKERGIPSSKFTVNRRSHFKVQKGVLCLSYDPEWNLIVTGSRDCDVRVWNPYVVAKSSAVLKGHSATVLQVLVRSVDHQIISISKDKNIRVWDLHDYSCKQNIHGRNVNLGRLDVSAAFFNERRAELIVATNRIGVLHPRIGSVAGYQQKLAKTHQKSVVQVLYNPLFNQIVTGGEDSMICLWDIKTGVKQMQFCAGTESEITCMAFDSTNRRLLAGARNGTASLWNFNNGAKLRSLEKMDDQEISDVVFTRQRIVTAGWNRHVGVYLDSYGDDRHQLLKQTHDDDILSLDYHHTDCLFASASYDGDIFIWSLETGEVILMFNMHMSLLPLHEERQEHRKKKVSGLRAAATRKESIPDTDIDGTQSSQLFTRLQDRRSATTNKFFVRWSDVWLPNHLPWLKKRKLIFYESDTECSYSSRESSAVSEESDFTASGDSSRSSSRRSEHEDRKLISKITDRAIYKILFFQTRECHETVGSLITACAEGWICTWSVHQRGGLLGYFQACKKKETHDFVTTMALDKQDSLLVTADTRGYIRTWDVSGYCNGADVVRRRSGQDSLEDVTECSNQVASRFMPSNQAPNLKMSVRAHVRSVTSLAYVDEHQLIASGSVDGSVRLWTTTGRYVGTFGQLRPWAISLPVQVADLPVDIPSDVRRVASPTTLRTAKGTVHSQWKQVRHAVNFLNLASHEGKGMKRKKPVPKVVDMLQKEKTRRESIEERLNQVRKSMLEESSPLGSVKSQQRRGSVTVWMEDVPHSIMVHPEPLDEVEETFLKIQSGGIRSEILGRINYKPKKRHRRPRIDTEIKWCNKHAVIYNSLPFATIAPPAEIQTPIHILRQRERNTARNALNAAQRKILMANALRRASNPPGKRKTPQAGTEGGAGTAPHEDSTDKIPKLPPIGGAKDGVLRNEAGNKIVVKKSRLRPTDSRQPSPLVATLPSIA